MRTMPRFVSVVSIILVAIMLASGQPKRRPKSYVEIVITDISSTSELLPIPLDETPPLANAKFGAKYFGPREKSDISVLLFLTGTKGRYSTGETFAVVFYIDDVQMNMGSARLISSVDKKTNAEVLHFQITTAEVARLAAARKLKMKTFNVDNDTKSNTFVFPSSALLEFKKFAKSVALIQSMIPAVE